MKLAIVGATGLVGSKFLQVLEEREFPFSELYLAASERSAGKELVCKNQKNKVISLSDAVAKKPDIALFSAGGGVSKEWAPQFARVGTFVVDNSSAWRMDPDIPLVVPEINAHIITREDKIIANPNCSTIQMVMALAPLHQRYTIKRLVVSTYQSVSGTGVQAVQQMENERKGIEGVKAYPYPIDRNCIPHCDVFLENDYTREEMKLVNETRKILQDDTIKITATAVRIPVVGGHSESINIEFENDFQIEDVKVLLASSDGIDVIDDVNNNLYPMPLSAHEKDLVYVGRIRRDDSQERSLNLWVVSDNLRKGAATNAIQIAEYLFENFKR